MLDALINPATIAAVVALMVLETVVLARVFARRRDRDKTIITLGNAFAGAALMGAVVSEMTNQSPKITGACLVAALCGHVLEVWLRLR